MSDTKAMKEYIEDNTITDIEIVRKAKNMPKSAPDSFLRPLIPIGIAVYKGNEKTSFLSVSKHFNANETYPLYDGENGAYPISNLTGEGMKMTPVAWTVRYF